VPEEGQKPIWRHPLIADFDASATVVFIPLHRWVSASLDHVMPSLMLGRVAHAVRPVLLLYAIPVETAAAYRAAYPDRRNVNGALGPAVAAAPKLTLCAASTTNVRIGIAKYQQATEAHPGKICAFVRHVLDLTHDNLENQASS
jgi:hypothetical protein